MTTDLTSAATGLPPELRARRATEADLERRVEFHNRHATASQWTSLAGARHQEATNPEPLKLALLVEDPSGEIAATGETGDGGLVRSPDGSWHLSLRVARPWRRRGVGRALLGPLEAHARANGAQRVVASVSGADPAGTRFAER